MSSEEQTLPNVFVTVGVSGPGEAIIRQLATAGYKVYATAKTAAGASAIREQGGIPVYADMLRDSEVLATLEMAKADVIINTLPLSIVELPYRVKYDTLLDDYSQTLVSATFKASQRKATKFVIHCSYAFLYGDTHGETVDESAPLSAGDAGLIADAKQAEKSLLESGLPSCVLRCGYTYGPTSDALRDLASILRNGSRSVSMSHKYANWVHEEDVASAIVQAVAHTPEGEAFNIVDDAPATPAEFLGTFASEQGYKTPTRFLGLLSRPYSNKPAQVLMKQSVKADNAKAKAELDWTPKYPTHQQGIEHTLLMWRSEMAALPATTETAITPSGTAVTPATEPEAGT